MATTVNGIRLRQRMGREEWRVPEVFGPDGWRMFSVDGRSSVIVSTTKLPNSRERWTHASIARQTMPTYDDLTALHKAVWGPEGYAYQCFVPDSSHVNIHAHALHLWGLADGRPTMPDFGKILGSI